MFNGHDLTGWKGLSKYWSVQDGAITGKLTRKNRTGALNNFLVWQGGDLADFELTLKYKLTPENDEGVATSGIQFRAFYTKQDIFQLHGYQGRVAEIGANNTDPNLVNGCLREDGHPNGVLAQPGQKVVIHVAPEQSEGPPGKIEVVGSLAPAEVYQKLYRPKEWNDYRIVAVGNHIQIFVNGQQTVDAIDELNRERSGLIGLEIHCFPKDSKTVQFKDLKLRLLNASGTVAAAPVPPEVQPRLEVLSEQAPNATEWALAPLDRQLPPDIRQNLTYLREDLLDEAKAKPKASPKAYALGAQLCQLLLATIAERTQTAVLAGYTAAQAEADIHVDSQSLSARRNYKMSWPQFAREKAERAELLRQQVGHADLKKERTTVDWENRTESLRKILEGIYAQYRAALRESPAVAK